MSVRTPILRRFFVRGSTRFLETRIWAPSFATLGRASPPHSHPDFSENRLSRWCVTSTYLVRPACLLRYPFTRYRSLHCLLTPSAHCFSALVSADDQGEDPDGQGNRDRHRAQRLHRANQGASRGEGGHPPRSAAVRLETPLDPTPARLAGSSTNNFPLSSNLRRPRLTSPSPSPPPD